jgi:hypothetical protein
MNYVLPYICSLTFSPSLSFNRDKGEIRELQLCTQCCYSTSVPRTQALNKLLVKLTKFIMHVN